MSKKTIRRGSMTADQARELIAKHGSQRAAADAAGVSRKAISWALGKGKVAVDVRGDKPAVRAKSLTEFRATYDRDTIIPAKIRAGIKSLGRGWEYEVQFAKLCGVSLSDLGAYRDEFADYVVPLRDHRRAWAGTVAMANAMKEML